MRGYPSFSALIKTLQELYSRPSEVKVVTVEEICALYGRDPSETNKNKAWLRNKLTPLRYYRLVKPIYTPEGHLVRVSLTQKGEEAIKGQSGLEGYKNQSPPIQSMPSITVGPDPQEPLNPDRVLYPYPLLDGSLIHISLPVKLTKDDARRIAAFLESIAIELPGAAK